ncbi:ATP-grasp domain-containing protein [Streptomyces sp. NPDC059740]|uniref:ATP-grasp domain-containing protein n=1 Tax=Streptomyces sp. NPDC059740 TaxID=3346926 RepID=UPI00365AF79B
MTPDSRPHLVIVGSGMQAHREYSFASLVDHCRVSAVLAAEPTWQRRHLAAHAVADLTDPRAVGAAVATLARSLPGGPTPSGTGLLTWDETLIGVTAQVAGELGLPHLSVAAAARCRDKYLGRTALAEAGLPAPAHRLVTSAEEAERAAGAIGFPVVVKPRSLAFGIGVTRADDVGAVRAAFRRTRGTELANVAAQESWLVEEFLDGPEISVDSVVVGGRVECVLLARKQLAYAPYFEEVGHVVAAFPREPWAERVRDYVTRAHHALGIDDAVTHAEVRLTAQGPRLVELNGRLSGGFIPWAGRLATGVDLVRAAADVALGRLPDLVPTRHATAAIRHVYPPGDAVLNAVDLTEAARVPGIEGAVALAAPGTRLLLPPRGVIPRIASLLAVGVDAAECSQALDKAEQVMATDLTALTAVPA